MVKHINLADKSIVSIDILPYLAENVSVCVCECDFSLQRYTHILMCGLCKPNIQVVDQKFFRTA